MPITANELYQKAHNLAGEAHAIFADPDGDYAKANDLILQADEYKSRADGMKAADGFVVEQEPTQPTPPNPTETAKAQVTRDALLSAGVAPNVVEATMKALKGGASDDGEYTRTPEKKFTWNAFFQACRNNDKKTLKAMGSRWMTKEDEIKDLDELTGADGGYLVPTQQLTELLTAPDSPAVVRPRARKVRMTNRSLTIPALDMGDTPSYYWDLQYYGGVYAKWENEGGTKNETEPDFKQIELVAYKLAGYTQATDELVADSALSLDSLLASMFRGAVSMREDFAFIRGTGVGQPLGFLNSGVLLTQNRATANTIEYRDICRMLDDFLPSSYGNAVWLVDHTALPELLQMEDGAGNNVFVPNSSGGITQPIPGMILGRPVIVTEKLPALGSTGDLCLCDFSYYIIGDRQATTIQSSIHYAFINDLTTWRFVHRVDGQPWLDEPIYIDTTNQVSPFVALHANTTS